MLQVPTYLQLPEACYQKVFPETFPRAQVSLANETLLRAFNYEFRDLEAIVAPLRGEREFPHPTLAQAYAGHQFGHFTFLGDGRAHLIGEIHDSAGHAFDVHLKGSGRTQFSRRGDGRAALGPMLREYIVSEAIHALGIPTTRALAVIETNEPVYRETEQRGAILVRLASSHLRVGTFELAASQPDRKILDQLIHYAIQRHDPDLTTSPNKAPDLLRRVVARQASLVAQWMSIGFIHGVMNTDNMTISGETIDYGPCAFMDAYDPGTVFSSIDRDGRYAFANQPSIALWNLTRLAEALLPALSESQEQAKSLAEEILTQFAPQFEKSYLNFIARKLGFKETPVDFSRLAASFFELMRTHQWDYTQTFLELEKSRENTSADWNREDWFQWKEQWSQKLNELGRSQAEIQTLLRKTNPLVIARNYWVEEAIEAAVNQNNIAPLQKLVLSLRKPFQETADTSDYQKLQRQHAQYFKTFCGT